MTSLNKIQNNVALRNNIQQRHSNIANESKQKESAFSSIDGSDILQRDAAKSDARTKDESAYSFGVDTDASAGVGEAMSKEKIKRDKNIWIKETNKETEFHDSIKQWQERDLSSSGTTNHSYAIINEPPFEKSVKPRKVANRCRIVQVVVVLAVLIILGLITFFILRNFLSSEGM